MKCMRRCDLTAGLREQQNSYTLSGSLSLQANDVWMFGMPDSTRLTHNSPTEQAAGAQVGKMRPNLSQHHTITPWCFCSPQGKNQSHTPEDVDDTFQYA